MVATAPRHSSAVAAARARGLAFLGANFDEFGVPRVRVAFDPAFGASFGGADADDMLHAALGVDRGVRIGQEAFSAMLALTHLPASGGDLGLDGLRRLSRLIGRCREGQRFRFFFDEHRFPPDTDCTAVTIAALYRRGWLAASRLAGVARELLGAAAPSVEDRAGVLRPGVLMVYWDDRTRQHSGPHGRHHDAVACANALWVLQQAARRGLQDPAGTAERTTRYIVNHLVSGRYLNGTRYYPSPEAFVYAASRLCDRREIAKAALAAALREAIMALEADPGHLRTRPLHLALRILAARNLGLQQDQVRRQAMLLDQQEPDGSWPPYAYYKLGRRAMYFGSATITTLFATRALGPQPAGVGPSRKGITSLRCEDRYDIDFRSRDPRQGMVADRELVARCAEPAQALG
jgi:hypothetical protein